MKTKHELALYLKGQNTGLKELIFYEIVENSKFDKKCDVNCTIYNVF